MSESVDEKALELRRSGRSFGTIAKELSMARSSEANEAFNRALRRLPADEQGVVRTEETSRLDRLADAVRTNKELSTDEAQRRLNTVEQLRVRLARD